MFFWNTLMGKQFFDAHLPNLLGSLMRIATELARFNNMKEKEMNMGIGISGNNQGLETIQRIVEKYGKDLKCVDVTPEMVKSVEGPPYKKEEEKNSDTVTE